jgi:hypothetical protein
VPSSAAPVTSRPSLEKKNDCQDIVHDYGGRVNNRHNYMR